MKELNSKVKETLTGIPSGKKHQLSLAAFCFFKDVLVIYPRNFRVNLAKNICFPDGVGGLK